MGLTCRIVIHHRCFDCIIKYLVESLLSVGKICGVNMVKFSVEFLLVKRHVFFQPNFI